MEDCLVEIAKYCQERELLALSRLCRVGASKQVYVGDIPHLILSGKEQDTKLSKNRLWVSAMNAQFPNANHLAFYGDEMNYFIAKYGNQFCMLIHLPCDGEWCFAQCSEVMARNYQIRSVYNHLREGRYDCQMRMISFDITHRYIIVNSEYNTNSAHTYDDAKRIARDTFVSSGTCTIIDLMFQMIDLTQCRSYYHNNSNVCGREYYTKLEEFD